MTSGVRIGTPALTTRGFGVAEMQVVADCIARVLERPDDADLGAAVEKDVLELCAGFPLFSWEPVKRPGAAG